jgi:hypothetical protein
MCRKRRISVAMVAAGAVIVTGVLAATGGRPWSSTLTSETDTSPDPVPPPSGAAMLTCGDTNTNLPAYPDRGIALPSLHLPATEVHPKAEFSSAEIPALRARATDAATDPHGLYQRDWEKILADVTGGDAGGSSADDKNSRKAKAYGFAYVITGKTAYRDNAVTALKAAFTTFDSDDTYIAAQVTNYAQAYDYIAGSLDSGSYADARARESVKRGARWLADWMAGQQPRGSNPRPHNHRSKAALALGLWSLVFSADSSASSWLTLSVDQLNSVYRYMFTRDGVYLDGYGYYWTYQLFQAVPFFYAARNIAGVDVFPAMKPVFEWMVRDSAPQGWLMNIEDSWVKTTWTAMVAEPYLTAPTRLSSAARLGNVLQWRFFQQDWKGPGYPDGWTGATSQAYLWPDEIIHIDQSISQVAPDTDGFDFYGEGGNTTVMRSDWNYGDPATRWVMFYGAPQSNNHDHCDTMQVLLNAENTVMLNDNGYGPDRFAQRSSWFPSSNHNVVTMDGAGARDVFANSVNLDGTFADYSEKVAYYDQTTSGVAGSKSWTRGVLFPARDYVVIADSLHSPNEQTWDSYLHARGVADRQGPSTVWTTPSNIFGPSAKLYALNLPADPYGQLKGGKNNLFGADDEQPDAEPNQYLKATQQGTDGQFLTIAVPRPLTAEAPVFTDLSSDSVLAATVSYDGNTDTVIKQLNTESHAAGELVSDGRLAWSRGNGGALGAWQVTDGTALSYAGVRRMSASIPVSATADLTAPHPVIDIQANSASPYTFSVAGHHPAAKFAGSSVQGTDSGVTTTFQLTGSGRLVLGVPNPPSGARSASPSAGKGAGPSASQPEPGL